MNTQTRFPALLTAFFTDRLMQQRQASPNTIASYRDTFRLLMQYAQARLEKSPSNLEMEELDTPFIGAFLTHLENDRQNSARSRNVRLAGIHSFFRYVMWQEPQYAALAQRVLAMPTKRYTRRPVTYLTSSEVDALLEAPDIDTWAGRRDYTLLQLATQSGLRASELIGLCCEDIVLGTGAHVRCVGKGRKQRCTPLRKDTVKALRNWLRERQGQATEPLFPNARGKAFSLDGLAYRLAKQLVPARQCCPSLRSKRVTLHTLRHTAAMMLLQAGVDRAVIALWLGHESIETTYMYLHADFNLKEKALASTNPSTVPPTRYHPDDEVLAFLKSL